MPAMVHRRALVFACLCAAAVSLTDDNPSCEVWAQSGECVSNPNYMLKGCAKSCANVDKVKAAKAKPRVKQPEHEAVKALHSFGDCSGTQSTEETETRGEELCLKQCGAHNDCVKQCKQLSPRSLHTYLNDCSPWPYLSNVSASSGMHVTCLIPAPADKCSDVRALMVVFMNGRTVKRPAVFEVPRSTSTLNDFVDFAEKVLQKPYRGQLYQAGAFF